MRHSHFSSSLFKTLRRNPPGHFSLYSTAAPPKSRRQLWQGSLNILYGQITGIDFSASVVPVLDRWVQQGGQTLNRKDLLTVINELRRYKNYTHALEVSMWMSDKRYVAVLPSDVIIRLDLIAKVCGIEQAENYFNNTPKQLKVPAVYCALLSCYCQAKQLEKAEATMQEMRDLGFSRISWAYNVLLSLYYKTGKKDKFDSLISEMVEHGIWIDRVTYGIRLSAAAAASDLEGIDKIMAEWQSNPQVFLDCSNYIVAASGYIKAGAVDKALAMLKRSEEQIPTSKRRRDAYEYLMTQYAVLGKKDETLRLWKCYRREMKVYNRGYICIMTSLSKLNDIESAEKIFEEWEYEHANYEIRIPNALISAYTKNGFLDKAEATVSRITMKDEKPNYSTWSILAEGYLDQGQIEKALETTTKAVSAAPPRWMPDKNLVVACLEYFKMKADLEGAKEFIELLKDKKIISVNVQERLLSHIQNGNSTAVVGEMLWDCPRGRWKKQVVESVSLGIQSAKPCVKNS